MEHTVQRDFFFSVYTWLNVLKALYTSAICALFWGFFEKKNWGKSGLIAMAIKKLCDCGVNDPNSLPYIYLIEQRGIKRTKWVWEPTLKAAEVS